MGKITKKKIIDNCINNPDVNETSVCQAVRDFLSRKYGFPIETGDRYTRVSINIPE